MFLKRNKYLLIGVFFLLVQFIIFNLNWGAPQYDVFFWFCNHAPLFFAIGFILKQFDIIKALINMGLLGQIAWTVDLMSKFFFDAYLFEITSYIFEGGYGAKVIYPILIHVFSTFTALYFTYDKKPSRRTFYLSVVYALMLFFASLIFTLSQNDINCIYEGCGLVSVDIINPLIWWIPITIVLIIIPTHLFQKWLYRKTKKLSS